MSDNPTPRAVLADALTTEFRNVATVLVANPEMNSFNVWPSVDRILAAVLTALAASAGPLSADSVDELRRLAEYRLKHFQRLNVSAEDGDASFAIAILACSDTLATLDAYTALAAQLAVCQGEVEQRLMVLEADLAAPRTPTPEEQG